MNIEELDRNKTYIIGVSGGPDSMALFDMCVKRGLHVVAAHMNYQKRDSAKRDMEIVENYGRAHGIEVRVRMQNKECAGNFQAFAREMRYAFYKELSDEFCAGGVLLAHQLDDHLETYIMQKQQKRYGVYFGIQETNDVMGAHIIRPLLSYTKEQLEAYCKENHVPYGIDESNLSNDYTRNQIRHTMIEKMNDAQKLALNEEIVVKNKAWAQLKTKADAFLATWNRDLHALGTVEENVAKQIIIHFIYKHCNHHITRSETDVIYTLIRNHAKHWTRDIGVAYVIYDEYGKLCIDTKEDISYSYTFDEVMFTSTPYFTIAKTGSSVEAVTLTKEDFPITIRNYEEKDAIALRFGTKKLNRWFIDRKIPKSERRRWPVVINAKKNVILVPKIGCDIAHFSNNPTCFVLK